MTDYSFTTEVDVRFQDLDAMGHVNNAVYATILEEARVAYFREVLDLQLNEIGSVLASLELDFRRPVSSTGPVTVAVRVPELGTSSLRMDYEIRENAGAAADGDDGGVAAEGHTVQVAVNRDGDSRPIPDDWREGIREFEGL
ncbi:acyl-CoA thioesterase [Halorussus litoreus]|uniref:acyl-CoA thioesterase n=1 Tax=Halorussus litoreus TaxID=1710536 RepID=UPI000E244DFD|nr:thioesterase family protein [Halorussus litoreus]